jgi:hypothetical protein
MLFMYHTLNDDISEEDLMKTAKLLIAVSLFILIFSSVAAARDFDWMPDFNVQAQADPSGFRARLETRFNIGGAQVNAVISNVGSPADAYMVLRLGEMSHQPTDYVIRNYKSNKGRGWGVIAKSLGIKPGSPEFHALKRGSDLYDGGPGKGKGHGKGKGKDRY